MRTTLLVLSVAALLLVPGFAVATHVAGIRHCGGLVDSGCHDTTDGSNTYCSIIYINANLLSGPNTLCIH